MKFGFRKPSLKKSISAQTTGRAKRTFKRAVNPLYGKKGMGWVNNPKKAAYNNAYRKTTASTKGCTGCLTACIYYPIYWSFLLLFLCCKWMLIGIISLFVLLFNCLLWIIEKIYNAIVKNPVPQETAPPIVQSDGTPPADSASETTLELMRREVASPILVIDSPTAAATLQVEVPPPEEEQQIDLNSVRDRITMRVPKIGDCIQIYCYIQVPICEVNQTKLMQIVREESYAVTPTLVTGGNIALLQDGITVACLSQYVAMCRDWLQRGDPIRCELTGFRPGKEHVVLAFYRNEEARLRDHRCVVVKLTAYTAEAKQDGISLCAPGDKLTCSEDGYQDGKVTVLDYSSEPIGRLPKKYADVYLSTGIAGIFFDHSERNDNFKLVPFVKIYLK